MKDKKLIDSKVYCKFLNTIKFYLGIYIQYGIIEGQHSKETVHLNYFDQNPLEPRYYMFGSYDAKVSIFDISVNSLTKDEEAQLRCSFSDLSHHDESYCRYLCHENCVGCFRAKSSTGCVKCRFDSIYEGKKLICLDTCARGFIKNNLEHKCDDIDECKTQNDTLVVYKNKYSNEIYKWNKCSSNFSVCLNTLGSFECTCVNGYEGDGFACKDINECSLDSTKCPLNSVCVNKEGGYECQCLKGFNMNNITRTCEDIDECTSNATNECQLNSYCKNTIGSYRCLCKEGFKGNGIYCEDINECLLKLDHCWPNSKCLNKIGSYICVCKMGYRLQDKQCVGGYNVYFFKSKLENINIFCYF